MYTFHNCLGSKENKTTISYTGSSNTHTIQLGKLIGCLTSYGEAVNYSSYSHSSAPYSAIIKSVYISPDSNNSEYTKYFMERSNQSISDNVLTLSLPSSVLSTQSYYHSTTIAPKSGTISLNITVTY